MTNNQRGILERLDKGPLTAGEIAHRERDPNDVRKALRRMEDRGWVRRVNYEHLHPHAAQWELTHAGRQAAGL